MRKNIIWYVVSFLAGVATSVAMLMLSLRFYVDIAHPYLVYFASLLITQAILLFMRNRSAAKISLAANTLAFFGQAAVFVFGAFAAFYCLIAIYPPNIK